MLKELFDDWDNDASWSALSQHFIANEHRGKKSKKKKSKQTQLMQNKLHILPWMFACTCPAIQSRPALLMSIRIIPHLQVCHRGDIRHHVSPAEQPFRAPA